MRNKKINVYPCKPQFYCIKVGFKGVKTIQACFRDDKTSFKLNSAEHEIFSANNYENANNNWHFHI